MLPFHHEGLDVYRLALEVARWVKKARFARGDADLKNQALRAARSVVLNIAEGRSRGGNAQRNHYRIARGSAAEVCAVLDLIEVKGAAEQQDLLRRINCMLHKMGA